MNCEKCPLGAIECEAFKTLYQTDGCPNKNVEEVVQTWNLEK